MSAPDADFAFAAEDDAVPDFDGLAGLAADRLCVQADRLLAALADRLEPLGLGGCMLTPLPPVVAALGAPDGVVRVARRPGPFVLGVEQRLAANALEVIFGGRRLNSIERAGGKLGELWMSRCTAALDAAVGAAFPVSALTPGDMRDAAAAADAWAVLRFEVARGDTAIGGLSVALPWFRPSLLDGGVEDWSARLLAAMGPVPVQIGVTVATAAAGLERVAGIVVGDIFDLRVARPAVLGVGGRRFAVGDIDEQEMGTRFTLARLVEG